MRYLHCGFGFEKEFFIDNLLVRIHFIIEMIWWSGFAPWEFEFSFPGSLKSTFLGMQGKFPLHEGGVHVLPKEPSPRRAASLLVAEVLVGLATDTTVYLSRRGKALKINKLTFTIRASDSTWHPGLPGRPLPGALCFLEGVDVFPKEPSPRRAASLPGSKAL